MEATSKLIIPKKTFRFKASFSPCLIIELLRNDLDSLQSEFTEMITRMPKFFAGSPVAIDLEKLPPYTRIDFDQLKKIFLSHGMIPVGIRNGDQQQQDAAKIAGLPLVSIGKSSEEKSIPAESEKTNSAKIINTPIRSGIQVCSKDGDLIVLAQVSAGAELVSSGHIHVYCALRGRALAGAYGNKEARIFCRYLEAELVSIAGYYLTKEEMSQIPSSDNMIQIYLENETLQIKAV